jgi:hypothetical protein
MVWGGVEQTFSCKCIVFSVLYLPHWYKSTADAVWFCDIFFTEQMGSKFLVAHE